MNSENRKELDEQFITTQKAALSIVQNYLLGQKVPEAMVKVATQVLATGTNHLKARVMQGAYEFNLARTLAQDPEELKRYIKSTQPDVKTLKAS